MDHIRFDVDTASVPDGCVTGLEPTNAKVQRGNQQYVALSLKNAFIPYYSQTVMFNTIIMLL